VTIESLLSRYLRRANRRLLHFPASGAAAGLPAPNAAQACFLYLHIPYCVSLCPFCSFHRVQFRQGEASAYFAALRSEIETVSAAGYRFGELYVGGGTPTVLPDELLPTLELVRARHNLRGISVETNPVDLTPAILGGLRDAGVTRLSVGVQSFDDDLLRQMQRYDKYGSSAEIRAHLQRAKGVFDTLNADMIFNFPHQTEDSLRRDLNILVHELAIDQVSFYPLMSADSSRLAMRHTVGTVDYSREQSLYRMIAAYMLEHGYSRSSAWCFSRRAGTFDEYIVNNEEYAGLGSGAFSYLQGSLYASTFSINHYLRLAAAGRTGTVRRRELTGREQMRYYLLMRLFGGSLELSAAEERFAGRFGRTLWPELAGLQAMGAIRAADGQLALTERGQYLWVVMMREFFTGVNNLRDDMRHNIAREHVALSAH